MLFALYSRVLSLSTAGQVLQAAVISIYLRAIGGLRLVHFLLNKRKHVNGKWSKYTNELPGNSTTTSHCVGILLSHNRRGVIKWPAAGTRRLINLEAVSTGNSNSLKHKAHCSNFKWKALSGCYKFRWRFMTLKELSASLNAKAVHHQPECYL